MPVQPFSLVGSSGFRLQRIEVNNPAIESQFCEPLGECNIYAKSVSLVHLGDIKAKNNLGCSRWNQTWWRTEKRLAGLFIRRNAQRLSSFGEDRHTPNGPNFGGSPPNILENEVELTGSQRFDVNNDPRALGIDNGLSIQQSSIGGSFRRSGGCRSFLCLPIDEISSYRGDENQQYADNQGSAIHPISLNVNSGDCVDRYQWLGWLVGGCFWVVYFGILFGAILIFNGWRVIRSILCRIGLFFAVFAGVAGCWGISEQNKCMDKEHSQNERFHGGESVSLYLPHSEREMRASKIAICLLQFCGCPPTAGGCDPPQWRMQQPRAHVPGVQSACCITLSMSDLSSLPPGPTPPNSEAEPAAFAAPPLPSLP